MTSLVDDSSKNEIAAIRKLAESELAGIVDIADDEEFEIADAILVNVKKRFRTLEEKRKGATGQLRKAIAEIDSWFKPTTDTLQKLESAIKTKMAEYRSRKLAERAESLRAVEAAAAAGGSSIGIEEAVAAIVPAAPKTQATFREVWAFEVVDADKVPRELCEPSDKRIREHMTAEADSLQKDGLLQKLEADYGIRFFKKSVVSSGSGR